MSIFKNLRVGTLLDYLGEWAYLHEQHSNGDLFIRIINKQRNEIISGELKYKILKPLVLTRTIVQKLGFKKYNPHFNKYIRSSILVEFTNDGLFKVYHLNNEILIYKSDIIYGHELQDLYTELTNEEVKYEIQNTIH